MLLSGRKITHTMENTENQIPPPDEKHGFLDRLRSSTPDIIKDNAPRIVAGMKICSSIVTILSKNQVFSAAGAGFIGAFSIIALFGGKKSEEEKARLREEEEQRKQNTPDGGTPSYFRKMFQPKKYPIESGTSVAMLSSALWMGSGIFGKGGFSPGRLMGGALSLASDANIVFTKEKIGETKFNPHEKGTLKHYFTELKNRPVLLSSLFNIGSDISMIIGGAHEYLNKGKEINSFLVGLILLSANTFQAIFVNKNDYNIEPGDEKAATAPSVDNNDSALQPPTRKEALAVKRIPPSNWCKQISEAKNQSASLSFAA